MTNRREFIRTASMVTAGGLLAPGLAFKGRENKVIGLQIYTLRNRLGEGLEGVLEKVAGIGYKNIEGFNYSNGKILGTEPAELKALVEGLGMKVISCHINIPRMGTENREKVTDSWKKMIGDFHTAGTTYLVNAYLMPNVRRNIDDYKSLAETYNKFGELCRDAGMTCGYHNHDFEFIDMDGQRGYDVLLAETDPGLVIFEPDLYWFTRAGQDPVEYMKKHPGRFTLWHLKDMEDDEQKSFAEVGYGIIDFERIFAVRETAGLELIFVEQDSCKRDEFESIKMSFDYINSAEFI